MIKITVGSVISGYCTKGKRKGQDSIALDIPGLGVLICEDDRENEPFSCIVLDRKQMIKLRDEIDKELENEE